MTRRPDKGLFVARMDFVDNPTFLVGQPMDADTNYASVNCREFSTVWLEFIISPTDDPVGDLFIEWSMDGVTFYAFVFDIGKFSTFGPGLTVDELTGKISVADPVTEARFSLGIEKPPPFLRGRWDFTAGSATGMSGKSFGRG